MRWLAFGLAGMVALIVLVVVIGLLLPRDHTATVSATVPAPPERVWDAITAIDAFPRWRKDVKSVERLPDRNGLPVWRESGGERPLTMAVVSWDPPRRMVTRIMDEGLPFGGTWTYVLEPADGGTRVTLTEDGQIYNPVFRFVARFLLGYEGTMKAYLEGLDAQVRNTAPGEGGS